MARRSLKERVVVILGGASGIGRATATAAATAGARVVVADVQTVPVSHHWATLPEHVDVTDENSLAGLRNRVIERLGRVDVVVNCAAIIEPGRLVDVSVDAVRRQFNVNALGTVLVTRAFLPVFRSRGAGHFVHLSSLGGIVPLPDEAVYSATKFAVRGFCLAMAQELGNSGIDVTVVCPDSTDTPQLYREAYHHGASLSFASRPLRPEYVAHAILGAIERPRREVCLPARRAGLAKLAGASTHVFRFVYPILNAVGNRSRTRFLNQHSVPELSTSDSAGGEVSS